MILKNLIKKQNDFFPFTPPHPSIRIYTYFIKLRGTFDWGSYIDTTKIKKWNYYIL